MSTEVQNRCRYLSGCHFSNTLRSAEKEKASVLINEIKESLEEGKSEGLQRRDESNGLDRSDPLSGRGDTV